MFSIFDGVDLGHIRNSRRVAGEAFETTLPRRGFANAVTEISAWEGYARTPLLRLQGLAKTLGVDQILYKDEASRFGLGSFKALGGAYAAALLLRRRIREKTRRPDRLSNYTEEAWRIEADKITLIAATDGNHGLSLAWGARRLGARCRIYVHPGVSAHRVGKIRALGAAIQRTDGHYDDAVAIACAAAKSNGWSIVSDTSWEGYTETPRDVMAGYGVIAWEIDQVVRKPPTHVFLQGGVGGLAAAVCADFRQRWGNDAPRVSIVEADRAACLYASASAGRLESVKIRRESIMGGLSCGEPSMLAWEILREEASDFMTIPDSFVAPTMRLLHRPLPEDPAIVAGESAVAGLAAVIAIARDPGIRHTVGLNGGSTILVIGTEGATDPDIHRRLVALASRN